MHLDLCRKEKEIENMTIQLQQQQVFLQNGGMLPTGQKNNYVESFLVLQLKKQNRSMKIEI